MNFIKNLVFAHFWYKKASLMVRLKFPVNTVSTWELCPAVGCVHIGWYDHDVISRYIFIWLIKKTYYENPYSITNVINQALN